MSFYVNVSVDKLEKFRCFVDDFGKSINKDCSDLIQALGKLSSVSSKAELQSITEYVSKIIDIIDLAQPDFIELSKKIEEYESFIIKLKEVAGGSSLITVSHNSGNLLARTIPGECLTEKENAKIKEETGWSSEIIDNIKNMKQYKILKNANLKEVEINGGKCLIKENIDLDYTDEDGVSNRDRMARGLAPLDSETGKSIELHHLGQKADSPLVELTVEEHRTGEYENGKKNQSLWHDNTIETEVHGEGNTWDEERKNYWKERTAQV